MNPNSFLSRTLIVVIILEFFFRHVRYLLVIFSMKNAIERQPKWRLRGDQRLFSCTNTNGKTLRSNHHEFQPCHHNSHHHHQPSDHAPWKSTSRQRANITESEETSEPQLSIGFTSSASTSINLFAPIPASTLYRRRFQLVQTKKPGDSCITLQKPTEFVRTKSFENKG